MTEPRLMSGSDAAAYCGVAPVTFSKWVSDGTIPKPLPGTRRWDRKAIDLTLDKLSGIEAPRAEPEEDEYAKWKREDEAEQARANREADEWLRKYRARKGTAKDGAR